MLTLSGKVFAGLLRMVFILIALALKAAMFFALIPKPFSALDGFLFPGIPTLS